MLHSPNPPTVTVAPSGMSDTASAALSQILPEGRAAGGGKGACGEGASGAVGASVESMLARGPG